MISITANVASVESYGANKFMKFNSFKNQILVTKSLYHNKMSFHKYITNNNNVETVVLCVAKYYFHNIQILDKFINYYSKHNCNYIIIVILCDTKITVNVIMQCSDRCQLMRIELISIALLSNYFFQ